MSTSALDQVRRIAADIFETTADPTIDDCSFDSLPHYDSLRHLNFVLAVEQAFALQLEPTEMVEMLSVSLVAMLIDERRGGTGHSG
jgi:acyl carrier protein